MPKTEAGEPIADISDLTPEFDSMPIPTLDPLIFNHNFDEDYDLELDLDFSFDDIYMDDEDMLKTSDSNSGLNCDDPNDRLSKYGQRSTDSSGVSDAGLDGICVLGVNDLIKGKISDDHWSKKIGDLSSENSRQVSSQGSGSGGSGSEAVEFHSHESDKDISSKQLDCNIKVEGENIPKCMPKRKKENEDGITESRIRKVRKSASGMESDVSGEPDDEKKKARLIRNRESAQLSRQRKKHYVEELEDKVKAMHATVVDLNGKISYLMAENASLRQQFGGGVMCPPPPGIYPIAPMGYPWMPCPPYAVNGSQNPVVPIPRLKPQQPLAAPKSRKSDSKKLESRKTDVKTKKVASISLLGLFLFVFLFGALVPMMNLNYGGVSSLVYNQQQDRIITVNTNGTKSNNAMGSDFLKVKFDNDGKGRHYRENSVKDNKKAVGDAGQSSKEGNSSLPLVASLYVPRNDKLVKIDGNLIIHSVLASEKAIASQKASAIMESKKSDLAVAKNVAPAWAYSEAGKNRNRQIHMYRSKNERRRALADSSKSSADDNDQQWFREGLAGPMLTSGMCTEVFQFDMSPEANPRAVIPASSSFNTSTNHQSNSTELSKRINRRRGHPNLHNMTAEHMKSNYTKESLDGNKSTTSPMIVSILVDPKDVSDSEADGVMGPKSLPRIFVVVLQERVKYVTYSCVLPIKKDSSHPHAVTT